MHAAACRLYLRNRPLTSISLAASDTVKLVALGKVNERTVREGARIDPSRILNRLFKCCQSQLTQLITSDLGEARQESYDARTLI